MGHSPPAVAIIPESVPGITAILPIGPTMPSNSDFAMTLPFEASDVSQELRAAIIKRTKNRWAWFSRAEDLDEERGTQLGTLGYLPWEIRQNIFKEYFDGNFREKIIRPDGCLRPPLLEDDDPPGAWQLTDYSGEWRLWMIRMASASLKLEVEYAFLTIMHFDFRSMEAMIYFLGCLKTYEQSLLRSVSVPLNLRSGIKAAKKSWLDGCAKLPSGLTCIKFRFCYKSWRWPKYGIDLTKISPSLAESLELFIKKIKRCWAPRADISLDYGSDTHRCRVRNTLTAEILASAFRGSEARGQDWLEWWASS